MKGFTLIEVLLALLIVAFSVMALLSIFISSIFLDTANRNLTAAISHAQYALEYIKNKNFLDIQNETWDTAKIDTLFNQNHLNSESVVIAQSPWGSYGKDVVVTVKWKYRSIVKERSIVFETLITGE